MLCPVCAFSAPRSGNYCPACGAPTSARAADQDIPSTARILCSVCGKQGTPGARFCTECGHPLRTRVLEEFGIDDALPTDERRMVTVLRTDLCGFTGIVESLSPDSTKRVIEIFFDALTWEVTRFGGEVLAYVGDAMVAVFGLTVSHSDDPVWAVRAALSVGKITRHFSHPELDAIGAQFHLRTGIDTGQVIVSHGPRSAGLGVLPITHPRFPEAVAGIDFGVRPAIHGPPVINAAELEQAAPEDGVLLAPGTARHVAHAFVLEPHPLASGRNGYQVIAVNGTGEASTPVYFPPPPSSKKLPAQRPTVGREVVRCAQVPFCTYLAPQNQPSDDDVLLIQPKLDRLSWEEKRTLRLAAIVGRLFWAEVLALMTGGGGAGVLERLEKRNLVAREDASFIAGTQAFRFVDEVVQAVAYGSHLRRNRRLNHQIVADWLGEKLDEAPSIAGVFACHLAESGQWRRAVDFLLDRVDAFCRGSLPGSPLEILGCAEQILYRHREDTRAWERRKARCDVLMAECAGTGQAV